jgi:cyanophycinase-like exopeptidase
MDYSQEQLRNIELTPVERRVAVLSLAIRNAENSASNFIESVNSEAVFVPDVKAEVIGQESTNIVDDARKMVDKALEYPITGLYGDADAA